MTAKTDCEMDYVFARTRVGEVLVAASAKGVCALLFTDGPDSRGVSESREGAVTELKKMFPGATLVERETLPIARSLMVLNGEDIPDSDSVSVTVPVPCPVYDLPLDLHGTPFQLAVWDALIRIPRGQTRTYSDIAAQIGSPRACRAVGSAVGANPVSVIVPCHRVVPRSNGGGGKSTSRQGGSVGNYRWGSERKKALIDNESEGKVS